MLRRFVGALLITGLCVLLCAGSVYAQDKVRLGTWTHFSGEAKVKEEGATGAFTQLKDTWEDRGIYKDDEFLTGEDSKVELMFESTKVILQERSRIKVGKTDEGLYVVELVKGSIEAYIETVIFQLKVSNQLIYGRDAAVKASMEPNTDIIVKGISGATYVENEFGPTVIVLEGQIVTIGYDRLKRQYIFTPSIENTVSIYVLPKGAAKPVSFPEDKQYIVSEEGKGEFRDIPRGPEIEGITTRPPKFERKFSLDVLVRYDWFEYYDRIYYYEGERETFKANRARLTIDTKHKFAQLSIGLDATRDGNPLEDLWVRLFFPKNENAFNFKFGQMPVPFGVQAQSYPEDLSALEYSQAIKYGFATTHGDYATSDLDYLFDIGGQIYGEFELLGGLKLQYNVGLFNGEKRNTNDANVYLAAIGRIGFNFSDAFVIGASAYDGDIKVDEGGPRLVRYSRLRNGADLRIKAEQFELLAEYIWAYDNMSAGKKGDIAEGWFVEINFGLGLVKTGWEKVKLVGRYDVFLPPYGMVEPGFLEQHPASVQTSFGFAWQISKEVCFSAIFQTTKQGEERYGVDSLGRPIAESDADQRAIFQFNVSF
jgi:hypothetical protein